MIKFKPVAFSNELSKVFRVINTIILVPIPFWIFVFYSSIFLFDSPMSDKNEMLALFIAVNLYPLYLLFLFEINARIYKRFHYLGYVIPFIMFVIIGYIVFWFTKI